MSNVTDAFANFQTALTAKLTEVKSKQFFAVDPTDATSIKTTMNIEVIGNVTVRGDLLGNENIN